MISVAVDTEDRTTRTLWSQVGALVEALPSGGWVLVGGLMVQLHALEHHVAVRVTKDIDLTVGIPGGSQALARSERVQVSISDRSFVISRPNLLGAILIKARSLMVHSDPASQREDLLRLLSLVPDPRGSQARSQAPSAGG